MTAAGAPGRAAAPGDIEKAHTAASDTLAAALAKAAARSADRCCAGACGARTRTWVISTAQAAGTGVGAGGTAGTPKRFTAPRPGR